jgi:hypothetical protein
MKNFLLNNSFYMKKTLLVLSITTMTLWIIGFFILKLPPVVHIFLATSLLIYVRSLLYINNSSSQVLRSK